MYIFLILFHVLASVALILIVLLQTGRGAEMGAAFGGAAHFPEQAFEDNARMGLGRERRGGRRPGKVVLVDASVAVIALADDLHQIHGQFERRELGFLSNVLRGDLVDGRAEVVIRALGPLRLRRAEERQPKAPTGRACRV